VSDIIKLEIYTDGACPNNGTPEAQGGFGMAAPHPERDDWAKDNYPWGELLRERYGEPTNQKCELIAVIFTVFGFAEEVLTHPEHSLWDEEGQAKLNIRVYSDSMYVVQGVNTWMHNWKRNGWKNSKKKPISNMKMWKDLDNMLSFERLRGVFSFVHVPGHSGNTGNDIADMEAKEGAMRAALGVNSMKEKPWGEFIAFVEGDHSAEIITEGAIYDFK
jgi:ribonuclease HI